MELLRMKKLYRRISLVMMLLALAFSTAAYAQNKPQPKPKAPEKKEEVKDSLKVSFGRLVSILETAQGWIKNNRGQWISSPNRIPYEDPDYNNEFYEKNLMGTENFKQIRLHEIKVDEKPYYALVVLYTKGYYKDPEKKEDWKYFTGADYYIISRADFKNTFNDSFQYGKPYTASLQSYYSGTVPYLNQGLLGPRIAKDININIQTRHLYDTTVLTYFQFVVKPVKDKRGRFIRFNMALTYEKNGTDPEKGDYDLFGSQYYEVPFDKFKAFARPAKK
jgi:hypothetical protein